mmetsp:Transcript_6284/g.13915  ORF Transcript_6284/g.13915 Transcript_6284/m.13915 type:complete len:240 (-) Transcript_6284:725-1444(-)
MDGRRYLVDFLSMILSRIKIGMFHDTLVKNLHRQCRRSSRCCKCQWLFVTSLFHHGLTLLLMLLMMHDIATSWIRRLIHLNNQIGQTLGLVQLLSRKMNERHDIIIDVHESIQTEVFIPRRIGAVFGAFARRDLLTLAGGGGGFSRHGGVGAGSRISAFGRCRISIVLLGAACLFGGAMLEVIVSKDVDGVLQDVSGNVTRIFAPGNSAIITAKTSTRSSGSLSSLGSGGSAACAAWRQ